MELQTLADIGEFMGGLGVVVTLIYLAIQIRSNTQSQRSENYARSLERMASLQARLADDRELTKIYSQGVLDSSQLRLTEKTQFTWILTELFGSLEFMFFQAEQNTIPAQLWARWELTMKWWLSFPGVITWWEGKPTPFTTEFTQCVERCIKAGYEPDKPGAWESYISDVRQD